MTSNEVAHHNAPTLPSPIRPFDKLRARRTGEG